eukprot:13752223-Alexandrium_andersonii.AAC.1
MHSNCPKWARLEARIREAFEWGDWEVQEFTQCGVEWRQNPVDLSIDMDQLKYLRENVHEIPISAERAKDKESGVTEDEARRLSRALGTLQWLVTQTDPLNAVE